MDEKILLKTNSGTSENLILSWQRFEAGFYHSERNDIHA